MARQEVGAMRLDHTGHWVRDVQAAARALTELGFCLTPFSEQKVPGPGGGLVSAGTANHCIMLEQGYLEFLTPLADTETGLELKRGIARHQGLHIAAFEVEDTASFRTSRQSSGFALNRVLDLRRPISLEDGSSEEARFSVLRLTPPGMPEGRFQVLTHHTPELLWQPRWLSHPNGALKLLGIVVAVTNLDESLARYGQWFGALPERRHSAGLFQLEKGCVLIVEATTSTRWVPVDPGAVAPAVTAMVISSRRPESFGPAEVRGRIRWSSLPPALGGALGVVADTDGALTLEHFGVPP